ncbi:MAG: hypothetical protein H5T49_06685 [Hadesarchaea archaeon]|nr:hypothetical protein [Hadesarchaea archaeon]
MKCPKCWEEIEQVKCPKCQGEISIDELILLLRYLSYSLPEHMKTLGRIEKADVWLYPLTNL